MEVFVQSFLFCLVEIESALESSITVSCFGAERMRGTVG